ncbi:formimidoylglutamase [Myroides ceti]|uniref:Formimidoylglutamase n=1 Tax=Paenimyroides ceti TaxID=395087 RepID=A0ABT8CTG0_9FLAO|nr:formimidoylglutamase [Paenimyroides ceti]MDN3707520.1 formimidoylglutamase [Paenimyroides ceti]
MDNFSIFNISNKNKIVQLRSSEIKFGERVQLPNENESIESFLTTTTATYILFGIPEDIGVRANFGRKGTSTAWESTLKSLLNIQHNKTCKGNSVGVLGAFDFSSLTKIADTLNVDNIEERKELFKLVEKIDKEVTFLVSQIIKSGKIPIIIGGGHNNAYGNIKGLALAKGNPVNVINFDAHTDFRPLEGRHSGNGFSYAFEENFLKNYFIFGLHENYTSKAVFHRIKEVTAFVKYNTFEQIRVRFEKEFLSELNQAQQHIKADPYGIELDLDSIEKVASSAITPSGFSTIEARQFIHYMAKNRNASYLHICEGAPVLDEEKNSHLVGKLTAYLITDFIKARESIVQ